MHGFNQFQLGLSLQYIQSQVRIQQADHVLGTMLFCRIHLDAVLRAWPHLDRFCSLWGVWVSEWGREGDGIRTREHNSIPQQSGSKGGAGDGKASCYIWDMRTYAHTQQTSGGGVCGWIRGWALCATFVCLSVIGPRLFWGPEAMKPALKCNRNNRLFSATKQLSPDTIPPSSSHL